MATFRLRRSLHRIGGRQQGRAPARQRAGGERGLQGMLQPADDFETLRRSFRWQIPPAFNIASAVCDRHAGPANRLALIEERRPDEVRRHGFLDLQRGANRLANVLAAAGIGRGDRVGILLGQRLETLLAHLAVYKLGAIAMPLFSLFGPEALGFRLADSGTKAVITDPAGADKLESLRADLPSLEQVFATDGGGPSAVDLEAALGRAADSFTNIATGADDPAVLIYTSGTTGPPKGALHAHRVLLGHLPGVQLPHDFFPKPGDRFWTPADWAWIGGLFDVLMPSLYFGVPVVAGPGGKFDPDAAVRLMARHEVRNVFLPPTALRLLRQAGVAPLAAGARLRSLASGGEKLGDDVIDWGRRAFGLTVNEFYGQTEANLVVGNNARILPLRSGSMGQPIPGHEVAVLSEDGRLAPPGVGGVIAIRRPDPVMFLGYWNNPEATAAKFKGDWLLTGDLGRQDEAGYLTYLGREDDLISSAGYRIGPSEVEDCLAKHPAVALCAVIGVPDPIRGEAVKAFIVPKPGEAPGPELERSIQAFVRERLAAHEYPRRIAFLDELPLTATGKVRRRDLRERERPSRPPASD
jgi:acetyl-CoA synthetase